MHRLGDDSDWNMEEQHSEGDTQPDQERDYPVFVVTVKYQTSNPPSAGYVVNTCRDIWMGCDEAYPVNSSATKRWKNIRCLA